MSSKAWLIVASLLGALAVTLGAFGAHGLPRYLELDKAEPGKERDALIRRVENFETAARYHMYHALALLAVAWLAGSVAGEAVKDQSPLAFVGCQAAGILFVVGIAIFSGCLYVLAITGQTWLGAVVPFGGVALILGWLALAYAAMQSRAT